MADSNRGIGVVGRYLPMSNTSRKKETKISALPCSGGAIISQLIQTLLKWHLTFILFLQYHLNVSELLAKPVIQY